MGDVTSEKSLQMILRVDHIKHAYCCVLLTTTSFGFEHGHKRWMLGPAIASHPWSTADPSGCVQQNVGCSGLSAAATTYPGSPPSEGCGPQPASHCTCCRSTLQLLAAGSASGLQSSSDRAHAAAHASPLSASTSVTPAGSCGVAGSAVSGLPALGRQLGCQDHHRSHKKCVTGCMDGAHDADSGRPPSSEKQWMSGARYAFSCTVLRALVRHLPRQYSKTFGHRPVSSLQQYCAAWHAGKA